MLQLYKMIWECKHAVLLSFQRLMIFILHIIMYGLAMFFYRCFPDGKISMCFALCYVSGTLVMVIVKQLVAL